MLRQRILTAVVLLALLVPSMLSQAAWPFAAFTLLLIGAGGWEWARLTLGVARPQRAWMLGLFVVMLCVASWPAATAGGTPRGAWLAVSILWVVVFAWSMRVWVDGWRRVPPSLRLTLGVVLLWTAWVALVQARAQGLALLLSIFLVVWVSDIAAYFGGRRWGRRKLAPRLSPGKTWEGAASGAVAVALLGAAWMAAAGVWPALGGTVFEVLGRLHGALGSALALLLLVAAGILGDLFESLVKRAANVKDSSGLLPGHGGVLDRIDALLPVFPLAMALLHR